MTTRSATENRIIHMVGSLGLIGGSMGDIRIELRLTVEAMCIGDQ